MKRLTIHTDRAHAGVINVAWSDDDMVSWTNWQEILLDNPLTELWDLGSFVQRQFRFRHSSPTPIRIQRVEALCSVGST
jgi:pullulanase/glycogen debranching enzyme